MIASSISVGIETTLITLLLREFAILLYEKMIRMIELFGAALKQVCFQLSQLRGFQNNWHNPDAKSVLIKRMWKLKLPPEVKMFARMFLHD